MRPQSLLRQGGDRRDRPLQLQLSLFCDGGNGGGDAQSASPLPPTAVSDVQPSGTDAMWVAEEVRGKGEPFGGRWSSTVCGQDDEALLAGVKPLLGPDRHQTEVRARGRRS